MFSIFSAALMLAVSPAPANSNPAPTQEYEIKKVCRTVQEIGSRIPQQVCVRKRVLVEKHDDKGSSPEKPVREPAAPR